MKKFLNIFFVVLGAIFLFVILVGLYFFVADPLNLKPLFLNGGSNSGMSDESTDSHPLLNESQQAVLEAVGINPDEVPTEITAEQEACFEARLGADRVAEIKAGASPTPTEIYKARDCI